MPERRAEILPEYQVAGGAYLSVYAAADGLPAVGVCVAGAGFDTRVYLSVAELREFCRAGLALADKIEPEESKPPSRPPSTAELRSAFGAGFVGGPGIVGRRPEDQP